MRILYDNLTFAGVKQRLNGELVAIFETTKLFNHKMKPEDALRVIQYFSETKWVVHDSIDSFIEDVYWDTGVPNRNTKFFYWFKYVGVKVSTKNILKDILL